MHKNRHGCAEVPVRVGTLAGWDRNAVGQERTEKLLMPYPIEPSAYQSCEVAEKGNTHHAVILVWCTERM